MIAENRYLPKGSYEQDFLLHFYRTFAKVKAMYLASLASVLAIVQAIPSQASVLQHDVHLSLGVHGQSPRPAQSPLEASTQSDRKCASSSTCGPATVCPAFDGEHFTINGRNYRLYCINAPFGSYAGLPAAKSLADCEEKCHASAYDCNALTYYPSVGTCYAIYSKNAKPYIWDNGYAKIGAIRADLDAAIEPGGICPLPGSDNQIWLMGDDNTPFKMSCTNQLNVPATGKKNVGSVDKVEDCAKKALEAKGHGFHYFQPYFPGGAVTGERSCEIITESVTEEHFAPLFKPNQYLSGLLVHDYECGDEGWGNDKGGGEGNRLAAGTGGSRKLGGQRGGHQLDGQQL